MAEIQIDEYLLEQLGHETLGDMAAAPPSKEMLISGGTRWLQKQLGKIRAGLCGSGLVASYRRSPKQKLPLVVPLAQALDTILDAKNPIVLAVTLLDIGLDRLCDESDLIARLRAQTEDSLSRPVPLVELQQGPATVRTNGNGAADREPPVADFMGPVDYAWTEAGFEARQALKRYSEQTHADY